MASGGSDRDAKHTLSKLLQMGTVAEYQNEFEILINQVTGISQSLLTSLYIFGLKLELQRELWRSRPTTLGEAFSLACIAEARFEKSVKNHFGPSKYEDLKGALSKLLQLGTVEDYQREFEKLMNRVTNIPDSLLISFYISGLKLNLQHELLVSRPTTLVDAFSLARIIEARFKAIAEKEQNIKEKADTTLILPSEEASHVVKGPLDASEDTLLSFRRPFDEDRGKFVEFFKDKGCVEKVLSATKLPEGGNSYSAYSPYHLEGRVIFEGVRNVTPLVADGERRKRVKWYVQGSGRRKRKKVIGRGSGRRKVNQECFSRQHLKGNVVLKE
ncbi:class II heat shock protein [Tanacetum coccineum]|uniref:Class II heat shock protein n=1 Tax=Tanacetum coccineum TaxID=301880 RepID=A0ABQ4XZ26_9ASTR